MSAAATLAELTEALAAARARFNDIERERLEAVTEVHRLAALKEAAELLVGYEHEQSAPDGLDREATR